MTVTMGTERRNTMCRATTTDSISVILAKLTTHTYARSGNTDFYQARFRTEFTLWVTFVVSIAAGACFGHAVCWASFIDGVRFVLAVLAWCTLVLRVSRC